MDPHLLRTFVTVARCGSFSAAADELGYTQSAISQHIAALEKDLGAALLERRPVAPTEAGARLLEHAGPILLRLAAARADLARLAAGPATRLVLGASALAPAGPLAAALAELRRRRPRLEPTVRALGRRAVTEGVAAGDLDLGLVDGAVAPGDPLYLPAVSHLTAGRLAEHPVGVALPADHPLSRRTGLRLADLALAGWIDAPDTAVPLTELRAATGSGGFQAALRYEGLDIGSLVELIAAGHGLAVLPEAVVRPGDPVVWVPVTTPQLVHRTELLRSSTLTAAAAELTQLLGG
ncbi:MAG TPA: LysR family transcriptional regulator [Actinocrinis sp.]|nr:LysR family transcriptional regulator [Actinocrinis sp.]